MGTDVARSDQPTANLVKGDRADRAVRQADHDAEATGDIGDVGKQGPSTSERGGIDTGEAVQHTREGTTVTHRVTAGSLRLLQPLPVGQGVAADYQGFRAPGPPVADQLNRVRGHEVDDHRDGSPFPC